MRERDKGVVETGGCVEKINWTLSRIIDFEYFLHQDKNCDNENYLKQRDREIYLKHVCHKKPTSPREILLLWLEAMKSTPNTGGTEETGFCPDIKNKEYVKSTDDNIDNTLTNLSPGNMYEEWVSLLRLFFLITGFGAGLSICLTFFSYTGSQPLNVSYFLAITLLPQICLIMIFSGLFLLFKIKRTDNKNFTPYPFLGLIIQNSLMSLNRKILTKLSATRRQSVSESFAIIKEGQLVYGLLFFWPLFILMQLFGIAFNIGILLSTIFRVIFFDTAFGWQSTLQMSAQMVAKIVGIIAIPWKYFLPEGIGYPGLEHIIGSRIILKDGIYHLSTHDLVSWWPFMCMAIIFYGLLPRAIMLVSGIISLKRSLVNQTFSHENCSKLLHRMVTPDISTEPSFSSNTHDEKNVINHSHIVEKTPGSSNPDSNLKQSVMPDIATEPTIILHEPVHLSSIQNTTVENLSVTPKVVVENLPDTPKFAKFEEPVVTIPIKPCIALIPDDINNLINREFFIKLLKDTHGYDIRKIVVIGIDFDDEIECIQAEYNAAQTQNTTTDMDWGVVVLQEAWLPPIRETINFIKALRKVLNRKTSIIIALTGKPCDNKKSTDRYNNASDSFFAPVDISDWNIWKMKLSTVADPWIIIEKLM